MASTLLQFTDLFPVPGSPLTGHTDAVEHSIDTGTTTPIRCAPRRMSPQKIKKEEACVTEMLTGGQIEPSDSSWSAPVVLVTKKDGGTRFCVAYRRFNLATVKDAYPLTPDRRHPGYVGRQEVVFDVGFGQWLLAGLPVSGSQVQDCVRHPFGAIPVQSDAVRSL